MSRHVLIGRFGPGDDVEVPSGGTEVPTEVDLLSGDRRLSYGLGDMLSDLADLAISPPEVAVDLAIVAALVYAADTRVKRSRVSQDSWTRELRIVAPVSDPDRWSALRGELKTSLDFLTGDLWTIGFRRRPAGFDQMAPAIAEGTEERQFDGVNLFSGGLDSLIGAIDDLEGGRNPLFVSHAGESATSSVQAACFGHLQNHYDDRILNRIGIWMVFPKNLIPGMPGEDTTRGRSFLFFALGTVAASGLSDDRELRAPENGLIALNVPLDPLRLGSNSTRTTHPYFIDGWNRVMEGLDLHSRVMNPYWDKTKGEMVDACAGPDVLKEILPKTMSCSSPTKGRWRRLGIQHCGYCMPCLIRRAAVHKAWGGGEDGTTYTIPDLHERPLNTTEAEGAQVRSFQVAANELASNPDKARLLIHKPGPLPVSEADLPQLASVYRRGIEEVADLLTGVDARPMK